MTRPASPCRAGESRHVVYTEETWRVLRQKRARAEEIMTALLTLGIESYVYGSVARGDVKPTSDIDIFIPFVPHPGLVVLALESRGFTIFDRLIVQATPTYAIKGYIQLDTEGLEVVSFPITRLKSSELDFYKYGGLLDLNGIRAGERIPGVDKRLMLIEPTNDGHVESCILGREGEVAKLLGVSEELVRERVRKLARRGEVGRTGVYLKYRLLAGESFEEALARLASRNKFVRRQLIERL